MTCALTSLDSRLYSDTSCATSRSRDCSPESQRAQPRSSGFFVRTVQLMPRYGGLDGGAFGLAGSLCRSANPIQPATLGFAAFGGGFQPIHNERTIMPTQVQNSPTAYAGDFFIPNPSADRLDALDAVHQRLDQAYASIVCLMANGDDAEEGFTLNHQLVINILWGVQSQIEQAKAALWATHSGVGK